MTKKRPALSRGGAAPPPAAGDSDEFARLLAETGRERFASLAAGDRVEGTVVQRTASALLIDVGQRSEAVMPLEGMTPEELVALRVGTRAQFLVTRATGGAIELSHALAARALDLERLQDARRSGVPVEGKVAGENKGGFTVELGGQRGFVPFSQMELGQARPFADQHHDLLRAEQLTDFIAQCNARLLGDHDRTDVPPPESRRQLDDQGQRMPGCGLRGQAIGDHQHHIGFGCRGQPD